jgi:hypothetical protein
LCLLAEQANHDSSTAPGRPWLGGGGTSSAQQRRDLDSAAAGRGWRQTKERVRREENMSPQHDFLLSGLTLCCLWISISGIQGTTAETRNDRGYESILELSITYFIGSGCPATGRVRARDQSFLPPRKQLPAPPPSSLSTTGPFFLCMVLSLVAIQGSGGALTISLHHQSDPPSPDNSAPLSQAITHTSTLCH